MSIANDRKRKEFEDKARAFKSKNPLSISGDKIKLHIAHYRKEPLTVEMVEL